MKIRLLIAMIHAAVFVAMPITILACEGDARTPNAPPPANGARLQIVPGALDLEPGTTKELKAVVYDETGKPVVSPVVEWRITNSAVASVTAGGLVTGVSVGNAGVIASSNGFADTADIRVIPLSPTGTFIDIHPELTYQQMTGWEGTAQIGEMECDPRAFAVYQPVVVDRLVNELGINRVRLEIRSGNENPQDFYTQYRNSRRQADWAPYRYQSVNDNDNPLVARAEGFQFSELDHKAEVIVQPLRTLLAARGERLYVNLNYVDFGPSAWEHSSDPQEYAELIHTAFLHLQSRFGWVPDAVEISLEPDNTPNWTPQAIGRALVATGDRLKSAGFRPSFIAPSNTSMAGALGYIDELIAMPRVLEYLTDVSYHRYSGVSAGTLAAIASRAKEHGLRTAMLEHIGSDYDDLHADLREGLNSTWQQFTLAFCNPRDDGDTYYRIDQSNPTSPVVVMAGRSRYLRQYFSFVRDNARRIGAVSGESRLDPLAFRNSNGKIAVVILATGAAPVHVRGLPSGTYGVRFTTSTDTFASLPDAVVDAAGALQVAMPAAGVMTIFAR